MSRIGKIPVNIPAGVEVTLNGRTLEVKGALGTLKFTHVDSVGVVKEENTIVVSQLTEAGKALWGTTRAIVNNMVIGVSQGYKKSLEINGVGYKIEVEPSRLVLSLGFSHKVYMDIPAGLKLNIDEKYKNILHISGFDKQLVGEFASKIRAKKEPEPYKGKGIRYVGEYVAMKAGKTGSK